MSGALEVVASGLLCSTRCVAPSRAVSRAIQTDLDPCAKVLSVDGIGVVDLTPRATMLEGFVSVWEDDEGVAQQGEG